LPVTANTWAPDPPSDITLVEFFERFVEGRADSSRDWQKNHRNTFRVVKRYFRSDVLVRDITEDEAKQFREWMQMEGKPTGEDKPKQGYAEATIAGHIKICRKVFKAANKQRLLHTNPFENVEAGSQKNTSRQFEVDRQMLQKLLDMAPNAQWRLLILLVRIGGMRNPSETRLLRWENIDFVNRTINVPGAKSNKKNPDGSKFIRWRLIPMFPELVEPLRECFDPAEEYVLSDITGTDANVYNTFRRIVKKAGFSPWPRLWHNLRASRDSELSATGLSDFAVSQLMGNSPDVSRDHYKFIPKDVFESMKNRTSHDRFESCGEDSNPDEVVL
jgi:integrase